MGANGEIIKGIYAALATGDVAAVLGAFDPAIEWREADNFRYAAGNPYVGPQAIVEGVIMKLVTAVDNFAAVPSAFIDGGDTVAVAGRYTGAIKATGAPVDAQFVHVWDLRNGKVTRMQQYTDTLQWNRAFGD